MPLIEGLGGDISGEFGYRRLCASSKTSPAIHRDENKSTNSPNEAKKSDGKNKKSIHLNSKRAYCSTVYRLLIDLSSALISSN